MFAVAICYRMRSVFFSPHYLLLISELPFFGVFVKPTEITEGTPQRRPKTDRKPKLLLVRSIRLYGLVIGSEATTLYKFSFLNRICSCGYVSLEFNSLAAASHSLLQFLYR